MRYLALFMLALHLASPACAESVEDARKELGHTLAEIKASDARQKEIEKKTSQLQAELKKLQEEMAVMGRNTSRQEEDLSTFEDKLAILEEQKADKAKAYEARQAELSSMVSAMVKLKQLPPEAIIAMPGKLDETMATARALGIITHAIEDEVQSLKEQMRELDALEEKIRSGKTVIATRKNSLSEQQLVLGAKIKERNALVEALGGEERKEKERVAGLTSKSKNLEELVASLQKAERKQPEQNKRPPKAPVSHKGKSFEEARGTIPMPAAGKIVSSYGNSSLGDTFSKGIVIETREGADVLAPYAGEVVFAGPFRDYGNIVIIRHDEDYHTMLSGMDEINCKPGQYLIEGEPIGRMGGSGTKLYMELREDGRPVNPAEWVKS